mmetsp:Transcript_122151/g.390676  ORF Transcript_122151/g.390676 Transcript_122151/m.390676 type:complete len:260 (-) Transcript_122151:1620-2399(-)
MFQVNSVMLQQIRVRTCRELAAHFLPPCSYLLVAWCRPVRLLNLLQLAAPERHQGLEGLADLCVKGSLNIPGRTVEGQRRRWGRTQRERAHLGDIVEACIFGLCLDLQQLHTPRRLECLDGDVACRRADGVLSNDGVPECNETLVGDWRTADCASLGVEAHAVRKRWTHIKAVRKAALHTRSHAEATAAPSRSNNSSSTSNFSNNNNSNSSSNLRAVGVRSSSAEIIATQSAPTRARARLCSRGRGGHAGGRKSQRRQQ